MNKILFIILSCLTLTGYSQSKTVEVELKDTPGSIGPISLQHCEVDTLIIKGHVDWLEESKSSLVLISGSNDDQISNSGDLVFLISEEVNNITADNGKKDIVFTLQYVGGAKSDPWHDYIKAGNTKIPIELNKCDDEEEKPEAEFNKELQNLARQEVESKYNFVEHTVNGIYIKDDVVYVFMDQSGHLIKGTKFPTVLKESDRYQYRVVIFADKVQYDEDKFLVKIEGPEFRSDNKISILNTSDGSASSDKAEIDLVVIESEIFGPYSDYASFKVYRVEEGEDEFKESDVVFDRTAKIESNRPYHVAILGGLYYSSLNDPQNVVMGAIPNSTDSTLYADNPKSQRALTIMAVFYPRPRDPNYVHKDLPFMQKWGVAFGIKVSENVFDDLLLGLNYEFSKGGSFTVGTHYGKHNAVRGYDNFEFGKTTYSGAFTNDQLSEVWDFGFFTGITIDLRILGALRRNVKNERQANSDANGSSANTTGDNP
ncbi:hypothetical protein LVD17_23085 [Fulvivirga ulvae]|uniref:hypothetical protein n=1 Tax=Fulvivirga ulvae TaxID=2904245 RepID=UPI001F2E12B2|nr:hypothetical protein [Fulvivirga ulvae]UII31180.1 hypothetical protein LVD17_23085 [Fulvivirga ulvae]